MSAPPFAPYELEVGRSTAAAFHARVVPEPARPAVWVHEITRPALVLGSTQRDDVVDADAVAARDVDVVRRRSGGGAVFLAPGEVVWVDVIVPAGHPGWSDDVHGPMVWLGRHLREAIAEASDGAPDGLRVHEGAMETTAWSSLVCFDGVGAGEVLVGAAKLVGISQRRTRDAARLQCCWYVDGARPHRDLVGLLAAGRRGALDAGALRPVATLSADVARRVATSLPARLSS